MKKIYIVRKEWIDDCETTRTEIIAHETEEGAKMDFELVKRDIKVNWDNDYNNHVEEEDENYFCAYLDGFYNQNHEFVIIEETELIK